MLRLFVLVLVLLNGLYFVWSQGWLRIFDFAPAQQTEPHRMWEQINPDALRLLSRSRSPDPGQAAGVFAGRRV